MILANSVAILTDVFPADQRGMALGINIVAGMAGSFIGLVAGGVLADGTGGRSSGSTCRSASSAPSGRTCRCTTPASATGPHRLVGQRHLRRRPSAVLAAITYGIQPYGGHSMGWTNPWVLAGLVGGSRAARRVRHRRDPGRRADVPAGPVPHPRLHRGQRGRPGGRHRPRRPAVHAHHLAAGNLAAAARVRLRQTPLWAGIYLLPLTVGFLVSGPVAGACPTGTARAHRGRRDGDRRCASSACCCSRPTSATRSSPLVFLQGRRRPVRRAEHRLIMASVPAHQRGAASGMRSTFQNAGMVLSIGVFFSLMVAGLAALLPSTLPVA